MKLTCDLCGGELEVSAGGISAVCRNCGIEYGAERLREKREEMQPREVKIPPERDASRSKRSKVQAKKEQKKMKNMWIILVCIYLFAFIGVFAADGKQLGILFLVCTAATILTLVIFKPWKVYGGKAI